MKTASVDNSRSLAVEVSRETSGSWKEMWVTGVMGKIIHILIGKTGLTD